MDTSLDYCEVCGKQKIINPRDRICYSCKKDLEENIDWDVNQNCIYPGCENSLVAEYEKETGLCEGHIQMIDLQEIEDTEHPDRKAGEGKTVSDNAI